MSNSGSVLKESNPNGLTDQEDEIIDFEYSTQMMY